MLDNPSTETQVELAKAQTELHSLAGKVVRDFIPKSFKDALTARSPNERPFDDNLDDLSTDDEFEDDGDEIEEAESSVTEMQGIPRISLPKKLVGHRREWCSEKPAMVADGASTGVAANVIPTVGDEVIGHDGTSQSNSVPHGLVDTGNSGYGPWMLVDRKGKRIIHQGNKSGPIVKATNAGSNRTTNPYSHKAHGRNPSSTSAQPSKNFHNPSLKTSFKTSGQKKTFTASSSRDVPCSTSDSPSLITSNPFGCLQPSVNNSEDATSTPIQVEYCGT
ncbi:hypothetical protein LOK49_LG07G03338 [Camellia lanceoleosa]|uniref:Uncharacterized protein n=1 Tax=Camellia lanceoleosa TaxID=1840588 RepID=A0ACC0H2L5_9ERIC|nr:hypothetical protein LOK49_LG07G03338 [Camellia lanceoleosa]